MSTSFLLIVDITQDILIREWYLTSESSLFRTCGNCHNLSAVTLKGLEATFAISRRGSLE